MTVANDMIKGTDLESASLEEIVKASKGACVSHVGRTGVVWVGAWT